MTMKRPLHIALALTGILAVVGCDKSPVRPPISADLASEAFVPKIEGPDILTLCGSYSARNDDLTLAQGPVTWTVSDIRVIQFPYSPTSTSMTFNPGDPKAGYICGNVSNPYPNTRGYGYATITAQWISQRGVTVTATLPIEFAQSYAGYIPIKVIIFPGSLILQPGEQSRLIAQARDQFDHARNKSANWTTDAPTVVGVSSCQCSQNYAIVTAGTRIGTAHVNANVNGTTSVRATITVIAPLQLTISGGPTTPATSGPYTWTANASGGTGVYTYQWKWRYQTSPTWTTLGTDRSQSLNVDVTQPKFNLQVTISSDVLSKTSEILVTPIPPPPSPCGHWDVRPIYDGDGQETGSYTNAWVNEECTPPPCEGHWEVVPVYDGDGQETGSYTWEWVPCPGAE